MTKQDKFESTLREDLHAIEQTAGAPEVFRLAQARHRALAQAQPKASSIWPLLGVSLASALMLAVLVVPDYWLPNNQLVDGVVTEELLFEITEDNIELYEELDFYYWLAETDQDDIS